MTAWTKFRTSCASNGWLVAGLVDAYKSAIRFEACCFSSASHRPSALRRSIESRDP